MVTHDVLVQEGWTEDDANEWATSSSLIFCISSNTIRNYIDLHQWVYSVRHTEHQSSKLAIRHSSLPSRSMCLCELYCYLRDAKKSSWQTLQLIMEAHQ
eukprot:scaffold150419_cov59-Attheya_sp.AAC.3